MIASVGYDRSTRILDLEFTSGEIYLYFDVPERVYASLRAAESKGRCFNHDIRDRFRCRRLTPPAPRAPLR